MQLKQLYFIAFQDYPHEVCLGLCAKIEFQQDLAVVNFDYVFEVRTAPKHRLQWRPKMNKRWANQKETT